MADSGALGRYFDGKVGTLSPKGGQSSTTTWWPKHSAAGQREEEGRQEGSSVRLHTPGRLMD